MVLFLRFRNFKKTIKATGFSILLDDEYNFLSALSEEQWTDFRSMAIEMVIATDQSSKSFSKLLEIRRFFQFSIIL